MPEAVKAPLEMFYHWEATTPEQVFLRQPVNQQWREYTWSEVADRVRRLAGFIRAQDFPPGSSIALFSANCADWFVVDLAIMLSGHISVPLYPGQDVAATRYIIEHSETRMIFLGEFDLAAQADEMLPESMLRVGIHGCRARCDYDLESIVADSQPFAESPIPDPESIFTILYTSGTTGKPKGVMHAHSTPGRVIPELVKVFLQDGPQRSRYFSYLPLAHAAERIVVEMSALYSNATVSFSEGLATFVEELRSVKPTFFFSVPRLWAKFKAGVDAMVPAEVQAGFGEAEKLMVREQLGLDQARFIFTGSAPCPRDIQQWYIDMGMDLRDGYGMTETFCDGCILHADQPAQPGCVGTTYVEGNVRLNDSGEICFKCDGLMKGYFKNPEKTAEVMIDGWYHTGDSGRFDEHGNLWVTGRISEVFKTTKGKFIKPTPLEDRFGALDELGQLLIFGHGKDQPLLLTNLSEVGQGQGRDVLNARLEGALAAINAELPPYERVAQIFVTDAEWSIDNGLLTPTMKLKRQAIEEHFGDLVSANTGGVEIIWDGH